MNQIVNYNSSSTSEVNILNMFKTKSAFALSPKSSPDTEIDTQESNMRSQKFEHEERKERKCERSDQS